MILKIKWRNVLLSTLATVLWITVLLTAPNVQLVSNMPMEQDNTVSQQQAGAAESAVKVLQSPAFIGVYAAQADSKLDAKVLDGDDETGPEWVPIGDPGAFYLDVFSAVHNPSVSQDTGIPAQSAAEQNEAYNEKIIVPGSKGSYQFTLKSYETFVCSYTISLADVDLETTLDFPIQYSLWDDKGELKAFQELQANTKVPFYQGILGAKEIKTFTLKWEWPIVSNAKSMNTDSVAYNTNDTSIGREVDKGSITDDDWQPPQYQLALYVDMEAEPDEYWITFNVNGGKPERYETIAFVEGTKYSEILPTPNPTMDGYTFIGWRNGAGKIVDPNETILAGDDTLTAVWQQNSSNNSILPIPIPIPIPITLPIGLPIVISDRCWLCWKRCENCICDGKCWNPDCAKSASEEPTTKPSDDTTKGDGDEPTTEKDPTTQAKPGKPVSPPKTGDSPAIAAVALSTLLVVGGAVFLLRKKRDDEDA